MTQDDKFKIMAYLLDQGKSKAIMEDSDLDLYKEMNENWPEIRTEIEKFISHLYDVIGDAIHHKQI